MAVTGKESHLSARVYFIRFRDKNEPPKLPNEKPSGESLVLGNKIRSGTVHIKGL